jgi:hypothetical protein
MPLKRPDSLSGSTLYAERNLKEVRELRTSKQDSDYLVRAQVKRPPRKGISDGSGKTMAMPEFVINDHRQFAEYVLI